MVSFSNEFSLGRNDCADRRDLIGAVVGLLTLFSALVLGLLIWTAFSVYSGQNLAIQRAAKAMQLDLALTDYGSEAVAGGFLPRCCCR